MPPKSNIPGSARKSVLNTLRNQIISMELPPGTPLSENVLAESLGTSRTPVREALIILAEAGLVNVYPKKGTFVANLNMSDILDAQFLREAVELHSVKSITYPLDESVGALIDNNLALQKKAIVEGPLAFFPLDEDFHRLLLQLSGHERLWDVLSEYKSHLDRARILGLQTTQALQQFYNDHVQVWDALKAKDLQTAAQVLQAHLRVILDDVRHAQDSYAHIFTIPTPISASTPNTAGL